MRWRAYFFLNPSTDKNRSQFDLKSRKCPPPIDELIPFEDDLFHMVETIKFRKTTNSFQENLKRDVNKIQSSTKIFVPADKTRNYYELDKDHHDKLLGENITKNYRKANADSANQVNQELKKITTKHDISEKVEIMAHRQAFITLKDHKESFKNNPTCRLINPAKSNLGRVSKSIVDKINQKIRTATSANQWRNTQAVIEWFTKINNKEKHSFIVFDIVDFYPSISEALLNGALNYAKQFIAISDDDREIIMHARKSLLFDSNTPWIKKDGASMFDVTMGSFDGVEICELIGLFALHKLNEKFEHGNIGLYRDDGLAVFENLSGRAADKARKEFTRIFGDLGLKITIQSNVKVADFLDVTLNLSNGKYYLFSKPNNEPVYINAKSNHPL